MRIIIACLSFAVFSLMPPSAAKTDAANTNAARALIRIALVGDSNVADHLKPGDVHRDWGQVFPEFVDTNRVAVQNFAVNGRSTKTFKNEGRWDKVLAFKPDYVFVQFGHNDSHAKDRPEATDAKTDFTSNLVEYVETAKGQGAIPILVTPMHRGKWTNDGHHLTQELLPYAEAMRSVASKENVPLIDLYAMSEKTFVAMADDQLATLFAIPATDRTHFNEKGARLLAEMVAKDASRQLPALKPYVKTSTEK